MTDTTVPLGRRGAGADGAPGRARTGAWRAGFREAWPWVAVLFAAVLWWPAGFWGLDAWPRLPLQGLRTDLLLLGATAAGASVSLLVRSPWPRFLVVLALSGLGWLTSAPARDTYPHERQVLAVVLAVGAVAGILLGARGHRGWLGAAGVLAVVAGLSPATWQHGAPLAVALALPFAVASWQRVAPTLLGVARVLLTWLVAGLLAAAWRHGWAALLPHLRTVSRRGAGEQVARGSWDFVRTQWWTHCESMLQASAGWFWVAAVLAVAIAATRVLTRRARRR